jgi:hypothetical protein
MNFMGNCCAKPLFKIIKIGGVDVGIKGLEQAFDEVRSTNEQDINKLKALLLSKIKEYGNFVSSSREDIYKKDLFNEYNKYCISFRQSNVAQQDTTEQKRGWFPFTRGKK